MTIKTGRLFIRPILKDDWKAVKAIWEDFAKSPYAKYDMPHNTEEEDIRNRMEKWSKANEGTDHMFFAVCLPETSLNISYSTKGRTAMKLVTAFILIILEKAMPGKATWPYLRM